ncbi:hypothetical protein QI033_00450 [Staphylococcus saprophyticus]|nr:hypothetical protein [Staphylococcus saprophyticus]
MKIKTKKQLNLPQLIEWAWDNPDLSHGMTFISNGCERVKIDFRYNPRGVLNLDILNGTNISNEIQFTLEEFEEITEDTEIQEMLLVFNNGVTHLVENRSLNYLDTSCLKSAYTMNDDLRLILIWRNGKLVE